MEINEASMMIQKNAHEDAHIIFGAVINNQMEEEMRVTVIATGFDHATASPVEVKPRLQKVVGGTPHIDSDDSASSFKHLKTLASSIKDENQDSGNLNANLDIPTFLRKHAD
jgi:cell division protein FtsZ